MQKVITARFDEGDIDFIAEQAKEQAMDKSSVLRNLVDLGRLFLAIKSYESGKVSIGKAAQIGDVSISEFIDVLAELGIKTTVTLDDIQEGYQNLKAVLSK